MSGMIMRPSFMVSNNSELCYTSFMVCMPSLTMYVSNKLRAVVVMKHAMVASKAPSIMRDENPSCWVSGTQTQVCRPVNNVHARISMVEFLPLDVKMKMHNVQ